MSDDDIMLDSEIDMTDFDSLRYDVGDDDEEEMEESNEIDFQQMIEDAIEEEESNPNFLDILSSEELIYRTKLLNKANRYQELFPDYLTSIDSSAFNNMSIDQLEKITEQQKFIVGTRNSGEFLKSTFSGLIYTAECIGPMIKMDLEGLSARVMTNPETDLLLKELSLEHEDLVYTSPMLRMTMLVGMSIQQQNAINKQKKLIATAEELSEPVDEKLQKKYEDI